MKLCYRGVSYEFNPAQAKVVPSEIVGKYRGSSFSPSVVVENPVPQPVMDLKYRGVAYQTNTQGQVVNQLSPSDVEQAVAPTPASTIGWRRQSSSELVQAHRNSIINTLERRLQIAYSKGDQHLISLLEAERNQVA